MTDTKNDLFDALEETRNSFMQSMKESEEEQETYWNFLSKAEQLKVFCAVVRRIHKGEIELRGTYRYVLYDVFGFGPESYAQAQCAGYLDVHNTIFTGMEYDDDIRKTVLECIRICEEGEKTQTTSSGAASLIKQHFNLV